MPPSCFFDTSNQIINFGTVAPGTTSGANIITVTDPTGNADANILMYGPDTVGQTTANWIGTLGGAIPTDQFYLANTLWGTSSSTATTHLTTSEVDTMVLVAPSSASANSVWIAMSVPLHQTADTYNAIFALVGTC